MSGDPARKGAVFLDRDGTIIEDPGYLSDPDRMVLMPGAAEGLTTLVRAGWPLIVVSNQSGIARGFYGPEAWTTTMARLESLLAPHGVRFTGTYMCPHHPEIDGPCECRKPGAKLFRQASAEHNIDLGESWFVGDRWRDVAPALALGGRGVLVQPDLLHEDAREAARHNMKAVPDLEAAATVIGAPRG
jgi:D-glycero-D-manno-heptose 1,7-bisphosphate phosphatase